MATFFLDPVGGNDANDGTTFANRWKTLTSGATAARIAPGDTIRVIKSPDPTSLGINGTFTNKSATVTLASAVNLDIDTCETAFTAQANVTATADTTNFRQGSKSCKLVTGAGFTTGQMAWRATGAKDLSAYQQISFWVRNETTAVAAGDLTINLYTGSDGATGLVHTVNVPALPATARWVPVVVDLGSNMNSGINSIGITAVASQTSKTWYFDNFIACKASSGGDSLNLTSLIGTNQALDGWYPIRSISGTTVTLDAAISITASQTARGYAGSTQTVTAYKLETLKPTMQSAATNSDNVLQDAGTSGSYIQLLGGWDRTAMTTQDGETWLDGQNTFGLGITNSGSKAFWNIDKINFVRYGTGFRGTNGQTWTCGAMQSVGCDGSSGNLHLGGLLSATTILSCAGWASFTTMVIGNLTDTCTITNLVCLSPGTTTVFTGGGINIGGSSVVITNLIIKNCADWGLNFPVTMNQWRITTWISSDNKGHALFGTFASAPSADWWIGTAVWSGLTTSSTALTSGVNNITIDSLTITDQVSWAALTFNTCTGLILIKSLTTSNNSQSLILFTCVARVVILASSMAEATKVQQTPSLNRGTLTMRNYNGTAGDHRTFDNRGGTISSETSVRHTASGLSWKYSPTTTTWIFVNYPLKNTIAKVVCAASGLVTISAWVRRTNTGITAKLVCPGGQIAGVASDVVATISAAADTWEQLTITFTPSETGTVEIEYQVYGGTTFSAYIDDMTISQA